MKNLLLLLLLSFFISCTSVNILPSKENTKKNLILKIYKEWKGTPYKLGGTSKKGVDCSFFVMNLYKEAFSIKLPRTTKYQVQSGKKIDKKKLKIGDLVFFKTSKKVRHVGIYIGNNQFIHASSSRGVMLSSFNVYWNKVYWQARRIM